MDRVGCNGARVANIDPDIIADFTDALQKKSQADALKPVDIPPKKSRK